MVVKYAPVSYASVHDDLIYVVYDPHVTNPTTYPNYKYIADIYVSGLLAARLKRTQDPVTGYGVFNISQIVRNYISPSFDPIPSILVPQILGDGKFFLDVVVKFGEEYSSTDYLNIITDSKRVFNHYNGRLSGISQTALTNSVQNKYATNGTLTGNTLFGTSHYLVPYFPIITGGVTLTVTPSGGGSSFTSTILPNADELNVLNLSPVVMNAIHPGAITEATSSYTISLSTSGQVYTINLICEPVYTVYPIHFLNQYGGFETKLFTKVSRRKYDIEKKDFGKLPYTIGSDGVVNYKSANGVYNEYGSVYSSIFTEKLTLNTDFLTDGEYRWLRDLLVSPMVYIQDGSYFFPVIITDNNYEERKSINDDLTNITISIEYKRKVNAQYR